MCIRDSPGAHRGGDAALLPADGAGRRAGHRLPFRRPERRGCLLYTSDAADERSSVDLGGRRILNKKNNHSKLQLAIEYI